MSEVIREFELAKFDFVSFIKTIRGNFESIMETSCIPMVMQKSRVNDNIFVESGYFDFEAKKDDAVEISNYAKNNDLILFMPFIVDEQAFGGKNIINIGNGRKIIIKDDTNPGIGWGDLRKPENGYLIEIKDAMIVFKKGDMGQLSPFEGGVTIVNDFGEFEDEIATFLDKFKIN